MLKLLIHFSISFVIIIFFSYSSFAMDYCSPKGKKISITLIVPQNFSMDRKKSLLKTTHDFLKKVINPGDFVNFSIAKKNMIETIINECFPGCPPTGFLGQVLGLGTNCNNTRMRRDKKIFDTKLLAPIPKLFKEGEVVKDGVSNLLASLESIAKFNKANSYNNIYILSSMNPFTGNDLNDKIIDKFFLNLVQNDKMPKALPEATYVGITQNSKLIMLWNDIFETLLMKFKYE